MVSTLWPSGFGVKSVKSGSGQQGPGRTASGQESWAVQKGEDDIRVVLCQDEAVTTHTLRLLQGLDLLLGEESAGDGDMHAVSALKREWGQRVVEGRVFEEWEAAHRSRLVFRGSCGAPGQTPLWLGAPCFRREDADIDDGGTRRLCRADADAGPAPARGHCGAAPAGAVAVSEGGQELGVGVAGRARVECQRRVDAAERDGEHGAYRRRLRAPLPWRPVRATPVPRTARRVGAVAPQRQASAARDAQLALDDIRPRRSGGFRVARQALVGVCLSTSLEAMSGSDIIPRIALPGPAEARDGLHPVSYTHLRAHETEADL
eukprot:1675652-Rhodomonas_salina.2